jgi:DNA polymerase I-like protein with 3'-5' exonuclease and polymerase domains
LQYVYGNIEVPVSVVLQKIERNGVLIDADMLNRQSTKLHCVCMSWNSKPMCWLSRVSI